MKKYLHSLFLLVMAIFATSAQAQDFSATVTWTTPGTVKVLKGTSPSYGTAVEIADDATSFTITTKETYMFMPANSDYFIESATMDGTSQNLITDYTTKTKYFKLDGKYNSTKFNGKTVTLDVKKYEIVGTFTLDLKNGAGKISFELQDNNGGSTATLTPAEGLNTYNLRNVDKKLYMKATGYPVPALHTATNDGVAIAQAKNGSYLTDLKAGSEIVVALTDPNVEVKKYEVNIVFTNDNPGALMNIRDWSASKFIMPAELAEKGYKLTVEEGTDLQFNIDNTGDYTLNSFTVSPEVTVVNATNHRYKITANTTVTIDATTNTFADLEAKLYTSLIDALEFNVAYGGAALETVAGAEHAAGTVTLASVGYTIPVATTEYTIKGISGKTGRFFFQTKPGYYIKDGAFGSMKKEAGDPADYYKLNGAASALASDCPLYIDAAKIAYTTPAYLFYEGTDNCTAKVTSTSPKATAPPYEGQTNSVAEGYTKITFDPEYNSTFSARFILNKTDKNYAYYAYADGEAVAASSDSESVFPNIKLKENSVIKLFYSTSAPLVHTLNFTVEDGATAKLEYDTYFTVTDFSAPIKNVGTVEYTLTPAEGYEVLVNGKALEAPYKFTPTAASNTITIKKAPAPAQEFVIATAPATGATVKAISTIKIKADFETLSGAGIENLGVEEDFAKYITVTKGETTYPIAAADEATFDESTFELIFPFTLEAAATEAGEYTISIKKGLLFATSYDSASDAWVRNTTAPAISGELSATVTVDPNFQYTWSFTPENGSQNALPDPAEDDLTFIYISLPEAESLSPEKFDTDGAVGPWITYNGQPLKATTDETEGDFEIGFDPMQWGQPILRIAINTSVFSKNGTLTIKAEKGAFTVNGGEASPAIDYSAKFGESVDYSIKFTPASGSTVAPDDLKTITLEFEGAETVSIEEYFEAYFKQGLSAGCYLNSNNTTAEGNKVTITLDPEFNITPGSWNLQIYEGSFLIDGKQPSEDINAYWSVERTSEVSFDWTPTPDIDVVNTGWGIMAGIAFGENETVRILDRSGITVHFKGEGHDEDLGAMDYSNYDTVAGVELQAGSSDYPNVLMISAAGGYLNDLNTTGELTVTIAAGALEVSGEKTPEEITYTWKFIKAKEYTVTLTPSADKTIIEAFSEITVEFPEAETAELYHIYSISLRSSDYSYSNNAISAEAVADAEHPTFILKFPEVKTNGTYNFAMYEGAFTLDGAQSSPDTRATYTVKISSGIEGIAADENGKYTVVSISGVVILKDADAAAVNALPAGIYVINGNKVAKK